MKIGEELINVSTKTFAVTSSNLLIFQTAENNEQKTMFENFAKNFLDSDEVIVPIVNESDDEANESMDDEDEDKFASEMYDDKWPMSKNEANIQQD